MKRQLEQHRKHRNIFLHLLKFLVTELFLVVEDKNPSPRKMLYNISNIDTDIVKQGYSGPRLNIKTVLSTYGDFHVKDKTAVRTSYL